jgi:hypothetical protein
VLGNYEKVTLNDEPGEPMSLAVLPDGRVLHNTRGGEVRIYDPATGASPVITTVPVYSHDEDGLQTLAIDPNFATRADHRSGGDPDPAPAGGERAGEAGRRGHGQLRHRRRTVTDQYRRRRQHRVRPDQPGRRVGGDVPVLGRLGGDGRPTEGERRAAPRLTDRSGGRDGDPGGDAHRLYLVFTPVTGGPTTGLLNLNWVEFTRSG